MAKRNFGDEFGFQTRAVHTGNDVDRKQEQSKDLSQWQTAMNSRMIRATSTGAVQVKTSTHATAVKSAVSSGKACVP